MNNLQVDSKERIQQTDHTTSWQETSSDEDYMLVRSCQEGDEQAFEKLVCKYQQSLFNIVHRHVGDPGEVEDIVQKIFVKVYFSLARFDHNRPFFPWLYRIAINQCYDELRRIQRRKVMRFSDLDLQDDNSVEFLVNKVQAARFNDNENDRDLHELLYRMLNRLPEKQRKIIVMRDLEQLPYPNLARLLGCSEQAARLKVFRARTRLRKIVLRAIHQQEGDAEKNAWRGEAVTAGATGS